ncbi:MAG: hypothetical protein ABW007_01870 [Chitinophagaceae bacterium]
MKALKQADADLPKEARKSAKDSAKVGAQAAKAKGKSLGSVQGKSAPAIRASGAGGAAAIILGSSARPYAIGAEMGSKQGYRKKQFDEWKGQITPNAFDGSWGYFLGPALRENQDTIENMWKSGIEDLVERVFPD